MLPSFRLLRSMTLRQVGWTARTVMWLIWLPFARRLLALPRLARVAAGTAGPPDSPDMKRVDELLWVIRGVLRRTHRRDFCVPQSLILFRFLRGWGYPATLRFGARVEAGRVKGHAWVDLDGEPVGQSHDPRSAYRVTFSYPPDEGTASHPDASPLDAAAAASSLIERES